MPSFLCTCGERVRIGTIPNPIEWLWVSDVEYDRFIEPVDPEELYKQFQHMLKCPNCERLLVFWDGFDKNPIYYEVSENT